ncbi:AMP-dependent synthetase and ligase [Cunninghamella echinulata]|nr:AMP-dependent synthetase and ligase [Cunninghamella echinulata]
MTKLLLPNFPLFSNALKYAKETKNIAIDDVRTGNKYNYLDLVFAVSLLRNQLLGEKRYIFDLEEQRVAILCPSGFDYVVCQWAIWAAGGVAVPLCTTHPIPEQVYTLVDSQSTLLLVHPIYKNRQEELVKEHLIETKIVDHDRADLSKATLPFLFEMDIQRRALIIYTSGTTGKPKGAVSTHSNINAQTSVLVEAWHWSSMDRIHHILPLHHVHGVINALCCPLYAGATVEMHEKFDTKKCFARWVETDTKKAPRLTTFMSVPTVYSKLVQYYQSATIDDQKVYSKACQQFRFMVSGSASLPNPLREAWLKISNQILLERYGMTELGMALSQLYDDREEGTVGLPLHGVEIRLMAESIEGSGVFDHDITHTYNTPGLLQVKGKNVFKEYWQKPEATQKEFIDGWFITGDFAIRTEEKGYYKILGRGSIDIIKTGGEKVSALEIEREILSCISLGILDVAVIGIPDPEWGQKVAAVVVPKPSSSPSSELDLLTFRNALKSRLAVYKVPTLLKIVDELPKNAMGKVTKKDLVPLFQ